MENFDWTTFTRKIAVRATLSDIYEAWTRADKIETWFLEKAVYIRNGVAIAPSVRAQAEDIYRWSWYLYNGTEEGRYTAANDKDHIQFTFAGDCIVDVHLKPIDNQVLVTLTQSNIPTDDASKRGIRLGCDTGWSFFLVNLKSVYENRADLRNKEEGLKGMVNN